jgi:hypothetical protein
VGTKPTLQGRQVGPDLMHATYCAIQRTQISVSGSTISDVEVNRAPQKAKIQFNRAIHPSISMSD